MFDKLMEEFQAACRVLALEEAAHKVRRAKAEADTAELIFVATKEAVERAQQEQLDAKAIMELKIGGN
jgi:hypothetical protein